MTKYQTKPVIKEAWTVLEILDENAPQEFIDAVRVELFGDTGEGGSRFYIETLEGTMEAQIDDYIIKGVKGEYYPCKPDVFHKTYEPVDITELSLEQRVKRLEEIVYGDA